MKVLMIGQLPVEAGGNYTTGAANVVYALTLQKIQDLDVFLYAKNMSQKAVIHKYGKNSMYLGYSFFLFDIFVHFFFHFSSFIKEWRHYIRYDHGNPLRYTFYRVNIQRAIRKVTPDIIHVHSAKDVSVTKFACNGKNIPLLLTSHGIFYRGVASDIVRRDITVGNLPFCDYFTGLTKQSEEEFEKYLHVPKGRYTIIPNGVDVNTFFFSEDERKRIRKLMNVTEHQIVFITVASLQERKGQFEFLKRIKDIKLPFQYWMIGKGKDEEAIIQFIKENHLQDKVKLIGYVSNKELYKYYSAADFYAHPSHMEGQALSEIEAYTTGLRILVNKEVSETVVGDSHHDIDRYYIFETNKLDLVDLVRWIKDFSIARKTYPQYSWDLIMKQYYNVYEMMMKEIR